MKYLIIANGIINDDKLILKLIDEANVIVCANGGVKHLKRVNVIPDVLIGDMDSIGDDLELYSNANKFNSSNTFYNNRNLEQNKNIAIQKQTIFIKYPKKKDVSDTELAVLWAIEHGATHITLTGVIGTRMDHTLSNIFLLRNITKKGVSCKIVDPNNEIYLLFNDLKIDGQKLNNNTDDLCDQLLINGTKGDLISIIPVTEDVVGLTLKGLEYPLNDAALPFGTSKGLSNVFVEEVAHVAIKHGCILVIKSCD